MALSSLRACRIERAGADDGVGGEGVLTLLNSSLLQFGDADERCVSRPFLELLTRKQGRQTLGNGLPEALSPEASTDMITSHMLRLEVGIHRKS